MGMEEALVVVVGGYEGGERHTLEVGGYGSSLTDFLILIGYGGNDLRKSRAVMAQTN